MLNGSKISLPLVTGRRLFDDGKEKLRRGLFQEAIELFRQASNGFFGERNPEWQAYSLMSEGDCWKKLKRIEEAISCYQTASPIFTLVCGEQSLAFVTLLARLAEAHRLAKQFSESKKGAQHRLVLTEELMKTDSKVFTFEHGISLFLLGDIHFDELAFKEALKCYLAAKVLLDKHGDIHSMIRLYNQLSITYHKEGSWSDALKVRCSELGLRDLAREGIGSIEHANSLFCAARLTSKLASVPNSSEGLLEDAVRYGVAALAIFEKELGADHLSTSGVAKQISSWKSKLGVPAKRAAAATSADCLPCAEKKARLEELGLEVRTLKNRIPKLEQAVSDKENELIRLRKAAGEWSADLMRRKNEDLQKLKMLHDKLAQVHGTANEAQVALADMKARDVAKDVLLANLKKDILDLKKRSAQELDAKRASFVAELHAALMSKDQELAAALLQKEKEWTAIMSKKDEELRAVLAKKDEHFAAEISKKDDELARLRAKHAHAQTLQARIEDLEIIIESHRSEMDHQNAEIERKEMEMAVKLVEMEQQLTSEKGNKRQLEFALETEQKKAKLQEKECAVCLESEDRTWLVIPCGHSFCADCVDKLKKICPTCGTKFKKKPTQKVYF